MLPLLQQTMRPLSQKMVALSEKEGIIQCRSGSTFLQNEQQEMILLTVVFNKSKKRDRESLQGCASNTDRDAGRSQSETIKRFESLNTLYLSVQVRNHLSKIMFSYYCSLNGLLSGWVTIFIESLNEMTKILQKQHRPRLMLTWERIWLQIALWFFFKMNSSSLQTRQVRQHDKSI